jgi:hypothetical protein
MKTLAKTFIYVTALFAAGFPARAGAEEPLLHCTGTFSADVYTSTFEASVVIDLTRQTYNSQPASINAMFITWDYTKTDGTRVTGSLSRSTGTYRELWNNDKLSTLRELRGVCDKANPKF